MMSQAAKDELEPLTQGELNAAVTNLKWFAVRIAGLMRLADKSEQLVALLNYEQELRRKIGTMQAEVEAAQAIIASANAAQARLDGINAELQRHRAAIETERDGIIGAAHSAAHGIVEQAHGDAAQILADARDTVAAKAEQDAAAVRDRKANIAQLDDHISARQTEHGRIKAALDELRGRLGIAP